MLQVMFHEMSASEAAGRDWNIKSQNLDTPKRETDILKRERRGVNDEAQRRVS